MKTVLTLIAAAVVAALVSVSAPLAVSQLTPQDRAQNAKINRIQKRVKALELWANCSGPALPVRIHTDGDLSEQPFPAPNDPPPAVWLDTLKDKCVER